MHTNPRLILDTHIWLDWLVFGDPSTAPIRDAVSANRAEVFIDSACEAELERVLEYDLGKRRLDAATRAACIAECRRVACRIETPLQEQERSRLPVCRDPDDQKFLEAALAVQAQYLITKDRALLELARKRTRPVPFLILTPEAFALQQPASDCSNRRDP